MTKKRTCRAMYCRDGYFYTDESGGDAMFADVLLVGGGGGGGGAGCGSTRPGAGGGGGGGVVEKPQYHLGNSRGMCPLCIPAKVGALGCGGLLYSTTDTMGRNGGDTCLGELIAYGGGGGGGRSYAGRDGASGGGSGGGNNPPGGGKAICCGVQGVQGWVAGCSGGTGGGAGRCCMVCGASTCCCRSLPTGVYNDWRDLGCCYRPYGFGGNGGACNGCCNGAPATLATNGYGAGGTGAGGYSSSNSCCFPGGNGTAGILFLRYRADGTDGIYSISISGLTCCKGSAAMRCYNYVWLAGGAGCLIIYPMRYIENASIAKYFMVGGGGGGGAAGTYNHGGGGGGGGCVRVGSFSMTHCLQCCIVIGAGGEGTTTIGCNGGTTCFGTNTAPGGQGGQCRCGGCSGCTGSKGGGSGTCGGGGGGGANTGTWGGCGCPGGVTGGDGGIGCEGFGGGGGGGACGSCSPGIGRDGGGNGTHNIGCNATANTGGGGGGGAVKCKGGNGGSGIVEVCYAIDGLYGATGGDCCFVRGCYCVHVFKSNGTICFFRC